MNNSTALDVFANTSDRRLAAIIAEAGDNAEELVDQQILHLQRDGLRVAGLRQRIVEGADTGCGVMLEDILSGQLHRITQNLGSGSSSCNIDTAAVEQLALQQSTSLDAQVDLVIVNRFGKRESQGAGFCCVIERAIELNIPVLTFVRETSLQTWIDYGGEWVTTLPAEKGSIRRWCMSVTCMVA